MVNKKINNNSLFVFSEDIELMFAALNILQGEIAHQLCTKIYGVETITLLKRKYNFLFEVYSSFTAQYNCSILEHLLNYSLENFNLSEFKNYILHMDPVSFVNIYLNFDNEDEIREAMKTEYSLEAFYFKHNDICNSYLGFHAFFKEAKRYITELFFFIEELRTDDFNQTIKDANAIVSSELKKSELSLAKTEPLEYSQEIMGKTFYNRGPYDTFIFSPSLMVPCKAIRFFASDQILFYSIRRTKLEDEMMLKQLKTIADSTRLKIISMLGEKEPLRGMDIANSLSLAPSTVSHHMEQLKNAGLLNEEQVKNSKYYSISRNNVNALLNLLTETLGQK